MAQDRYMRDGNAGTRYPRPRQQMQENDNQRGMPAQRTDGRPVSRYQAEDLTVPRGERYAYDPQMLTGRTAANGMNEINPEFAQRNRAVQGPAFADPQNPAEYPYPHEGRRERLYELFQQWLDEYGLQ